MELNTIWFLLGMIFGTAIGVVGMFLKQKNTPKTILVRPTNLVLTARIKDLKTELVATEKNLNILKERLQKYESTFHTTEKS